MSKMKLPEEIAKHAGDQFSKEFLDHYLAQGLGAMTKRDIDILVMHLLQKHGNLTNRTNHELSHQLQLTETRVRSLRYEARLKYPPEESNYIERRVLYALAQSQFDANKGAIRFIVEDAYVRYALQARMKSRGAVHDTSFNREIVSVKPDQLIDLIEELYGKDTAKTFKKEFDKVLAAESDITFAEVKKKLILGAVGTIPGLTVKAATAWLTGGTL
ncbi:MAG: hypothetical protein ACE37H_03505 [Phycisphaeraceae bacterium]